MFFELFFTKQGLSCLVILLTIAFAFWVKVKLES